MIFPYEEFDLSGVRTYPLATRKSKANAADFAKPSRPGQTVAAFVESLPDILAGADFKAAVAALRGAHASGAGIVWGIGAHVIKTGLTPVLIDLMERGFVSALATNGAGIIHDFELALSGATSEDVDEALGPGRFGMAEETGHAAQCGDQRGGRARPRHRPGGGTARLNAVTPAASFVESAGAAARLEIPVTVHVAIGTDIIHMHPHADGAALGEGSLRDFRYFVSNVAGLAGGVYLNCGSAVVLPEVFLKAVALARNAGVAARRAHHREHRLHAACTARTRTS